MSASVIENASDVVIVGGGLVGTSTALFLRKRGRSVTLLESGLVGQQASGTNFGNVRRQGRPLHQLPLANRANPIWREMKALVGADVEYLESGHVRVCYRSSPDLVGELEAYAAEARQAGLELELLSGDAMRRRFPFLGPEVLAASYSARDGHANPRLAAPAFARAAVRAGATVCENARVAVVEKNGEDFRAVCDDGRAFRAPVLLVAAGAWGSLLSGQFREPVPVAVRGPTMSVTEPVPYGVAPAVGVFTKTSSESVYFRQIPRGNVIIGGGPRADAHLDFRRAKVDPRNTLHQFHQIGRLAPALARLNVIRVWSGVEGYTPDALPVMGPSGGTGGLYYAFGFSGSGFQIGPAVGEVMAELIDTGATAIDLAPYRVSRFGAA